MLPIGALFILGPIVSVVLNGLRAPDGGSDVSLLVGASPALGMALGCAMLAAASMYGLVCTRLLDPRTGTLSAGFMLAWAAWRTGNLAEVYRLGADTGTLVTLAVEAAIVCSLTLVLCLLIAQWARQDHRPTPGDLPGPHLASLRQLGQLPVLVGVGAGTVVALVVAHLVAFNPLRGQTLMAGVLGAIAAGAISRLVICSMREGDAPSVAPFAAVLLAATIAPLIGLVAPGGSKLEAAAVAGTLPGPLVIQPLDWAAGMLIGTPIGLAWSGSAITRSSQTQRARKTAS